MNMDYDYTDDTLGNRNINKKGYKEYQSKKGFEKYLEYRISKNSKKDPDIASKKLQEVYKAKWGRYSDPCIKYIHSDVMTSAQTLISHYYLKECAKEWQHYKKQFNCPNAKYLSAISMRKIVRKIDEYPGFKEIFVEEKGERYIYIREFIRLYHTIGNYIPVPEYFNTHRCGNFANHDMWDLTLIKIFEYFKFKKEKNEKEAYESLKELLHLKDINDENRHVIDSSKIWLESYKNWKEFIRENYLQDYVNLKNDWPVKEEFTNIHKWEKPFPEGNYLKYFKLVTDTIKKRGERILSCERVKIENE